MVTLADVEFVHEGFEDGTAGEVCWLHLPGHLPLDDATAVFWAALVSEAGERAGFGDGEPHPVLIGRGGPHHAWLKRHQDGIAIGRFQYTVRPAVQQTPERDKAMMAHGWSPVTVADVGMNAQPAPACGRPSCFEPGVYGARGVDLGEPDRRWMWLCSRHYAELGDGYDLLASAG